MDRKTCGLAGAGRVGTALGTALAIRENLEWVLARSDESAARAMGLPGKRRIFRSIKEIQVLPDIIILAVADSSIEPVGEEFASKFDNDLAGRLVMHTSGIVPVHVLEPCREKGALTASVHPYQTFYHSSPEILDNIGWGIETRDDYETFARFIRSINGNPFDLGALSPVNRALYHASAVAVSNYMTTIVTLSRQIAQLIGLPAASFLPPIARTTLENNLAAIETGEFPLTGPIARGDIGALEAHLKALSTGKSLKNIYITLAKATLEEAILNKMITKEKYREIISLLDKS